MFDAFISGQSIVSNRTLSRAEIYLQGYRDLRRTGRVGQLEKKTLQVIIYTESLVTATQTNSVSSCSTLFRFFKNPTRLIF